MRGPPSHCRPVQFSSCDANELQGDDVIAGVRYSPAAMINPDTTSTPVSTEDSPLYPGNGRPSSRRSLADIILGSRDAIASVIACVGVMSVGFSLGYSSPALQDEHLAELLNDTARQSWFGSLLTVGAMAGGPLGAMFAGLLGRKATLILCNVPLVLGWFLIICAINVVFIYAGRYAHIRRFSLFHVSTRDFRVSLWSQNYRAPE